MQIHPYLFFGGRCEEALAFYQRSLGASIELLQRFKDAPSERGVPMGPPEGIMHATLRISGNIIFTSDGDGKPSPMSGIALSISVKDFTEGERLSAVLGEGGNIVMPFQKTFWTSGFGMLTDRFGIAWMINCKH